MIRLGVVLGVDGVHDNDNFTKKEVLYKLWVNLIHLLLNKISLYALKQFLFDLQTASNNVVRVSTS